jgi:uncharacterized protein YbjT (DUF2867 family)
MTKTILVTGGTGTLGVHVVRLLREAGQEVRVGSRRTGDGMATIDWKTGEGLDAAVSGVDAIVHCAGAFKDNDVDRKILAAAGDTHLLYVSIVGVDKVPFAYYRKKFDSEQLIEKSGVPHTILRATQFHDLLRMLFAGAARSPLMPVPGFSFQPIDVREVAARLTELALGDPAGRVRDIGGPEIRHARELAKMYLESVGRKRVIVPVRLPGAAFRAYRAGGHWTPDNRARITFEQYLAEQRNLSSVSYRGQR